MHVIARVLAVAYLALAAIALVVYAQATVNYVNVAEITRNIEGRVSVASVQLNWTGDRNDSAAVYVRINVTNPGKIAILVMSTDFVLYMDDPLDPRPWYDQDKLRDEEIQPGGFNRGREEGIVCAPGQTRTLHAVTTVLAGTPRMDDFYRPDANGRYYPVIWQPRIVYTFIDIDVTNPVYMAPFYASQGVIPTG